MEDENQKIVQQLESIHREIKRQNSFPRLFGVGIVYGIGFFVGSAIIATIVFGLVGPWFARVGWISSAFQTGATMLGH